MLLTLNWWIPSFSRGNPSFLTIRGCQKTKGISLYWDECNIHSNNKWHWLLWYHWRHFPLVLKCRSALLSCRCYLAATSIIIPCYGQSRNGWSRTSCKKVTNTSLVILKLANATEIHDQQSWLLVQHKGRKDDTAISLTETKPKSRYRFFQTYSVNRQ